MKNEVLEQAFKAGASTFTAMVAEVAGQLFNQGFNISPNGSVVRDANKRARKASYPCVAVQFQVVGKSKSDHLIEFPDDVVAQLYAWMIGADSSGEVNAEVLEGLQEGANQVFGQLEAATDGQDNAFKAKNVVVKRYESGKELDLQVSGKGVEADHQITAGGQEFSVKHILWIDDSDDAFGDDDFTNDEPVDVYPAEFSALSGSGNGNGDANSIDMLLDVELEILVQLGKKTMTIRDVLKLGKGSVIELEKAAGEHLDIFVNRRKLAEGEVVVIDDHFGIRISQLLSPQERIKSLG